MPMAMDEALQYNIQLRKRIAMRINAIDAEMREVDALLSSLKTSSRKRQRVAAASADDLVVRSLPPEAIGAKKKWSPASVRLLLHLTNDVAVNLLEYNAPLWTGVSASLRRHGYNFSGFDCFTEWRSRQLDTQPFSPEEDAHIRNLADVDRIQWKAVAHQLRDQYGSKRSPFQLAQRYFEHVRPILSTGISATAMQDFLTSHKLDHNTDLDKLCLMLQATCCKGVRVAPNQIKVMVASLLEPKGTKQLVYAVLFRWKDVPPHVPAKLASVYGQFSLVEVSKLAGCSEEEVSARIRAALLLRKRPMLQLYYEKLSTDIFGHADCATLVYREAFRIHSSSAYECSRS